MPLYLTSQAKHVSCHKNLVNLVAYLLHKDLVGTQYSWLGSIVYVAQMIWQPVSSYFLVKLPVAKWRTLFPQCPATTITYYLDPVFVNVLLWGVAVSCTAAANDFGSLLATRFFLGIFEATVGRQRTAATPPTTPDIRY